jgi:Tfp pilus assembly protein PilV
MRRTQAGDSLIEIVIAVVVIGAVVSALLTAIVTNENGTTSHRELVTADNVLRNFAEKIKSDVRRDCSAAGIVWTSTYTQRTGYPTNALSNATRTCPALDSTQQIDLTVTTPGAVAKHLSIVVRTP